jgi:hypothetical protein
LVDAGVRITPGPTAPKAGDSATSKRVEAGPGKRANAPGLDGDFDVVVAIVLEGDPFPRRLRGERVFKIQGAGPGTFKPQPVFFFLTGLPLLSEAPLSTKSSQTMSLLGTASISIRKYLRLVRSSLLRKPKHMFSPAWTVMPLVALVTAVQPLPPLTGGLLVPAGLLVLV